MSRVLGIGFHSRGLLCALLLLVFGAGAALAEAGPSSATSYPPGYPEPGERAIADWEASNPWHYSTDPLFSLTRGLSEEQLPEAGRYALYVVTVPLDLVQLPAAAVAGLFGD